MPKYCINTLFNPLMSSINELSLLIGSLFGIGTIPLWITQIHLVLRSMFSLSGMRLEIHMVMILQQ